MGPFILVSGDLQPYRRSFLGKAVNDWEYELRTGRGIKTGID